MRLAVGRFNCFLCIYIYIIDDGFYFVVCVDERHAIFDLDPVQGLTNGGAVVVGSSNPVTNTHSKRKSSGVKKSQAAKVADSLKITLKRNNLRSGSQSDAQSGQLQNEKEQMFVDGSKDGNTAEYTEQISK